MALRVVYKFLSICVRITAVAVVIGRVATIHVKRQPFGPKMCQDLYLQTAGWTSHVYSTFYLSCHITNISENKQRCIVDRSQGTHALAGHLACPRSFKVIQSRMKGPQCVKYLEHEKQGKEQEKQKWTRILLAPYLIRGSKYPRQLFICNRTLQRYHFQSKLTFFFALAYIPSMKTLLVATDNELISTSLDMITYTILKSSITVLAMGVDDKNRLVFMVKRDNRYDTSLIKMTTTDYSYDVLHTFRRISFVYIAIDTKRNLIYSNTMDAIRSCNYDGTNFKVIFKGTPLNALSLDTNRNLLYFSHGKSIVQWSVSENTKVKLQSFGTGYMMYYDNVLYVMRKGEFGAIRKKRFFVIVKRISVNAIVLLP